MLNGKKEKCLRRNMIEIKLRYASRNRAAELMYKFVVSDAVSVSTNSSLIKFFVVLTLTMATKNLWGKNPLRCFVSFVAKKNSLGNGSTRFGVAVPVVVNLFPRYGWSLRLPTTPRAIHGSTTPWS